MSALKLCFLRQSSITKNLFQQRNYSVPQKKAKSIESLMARHPQQKPQKQPQILPSTDGKPQKSFFISFLPYLTGISFLPYLTGNSSKHILLKLVKII